VKNEALECGSDCLHLVDNKDSATCAKFELQVRESNPQNCGSVGTKYKYKHLIVFVIVIAQVKCQKKRFKCCRRKSLHN